MRMVDVLQDLYLTRHALDVALAKERGESVCVRESRHGREAACLISKGEERGERVCV